MRYLVGILGLGLIVVGLVFWLVTIGDSTTTVLQTSTTSVSGTSPSETVVTGKKTTTQPLQRGSDAVVGLLIGMGGLLFLVAAFWGRITEIGLPGGGSIKVAEAETPVAGVEDAAQSIRDAIPVSGKSPPEFAQLMSSASIFIVGKTKEIAAQKEEVVVVGLGVGDKWVLPNLFFLVYALERWTSVSLLVFTESNDTTESIYVGCTTPGALRDHLEGVRPDLLQARAAIADSDLDQAGPDFFTQWAEIQASTPHAQQQVTWVTGNLLKELAGNTLIASVEIESRDELRASDLRAILDFPHKYVPVTQARVLVATVDQSQVALRLGRSAVRIR